MRVSRARFFCKSAWICLLSRLAVLWMELLGTSTSMVYIVEERGA